MVMLTDRYLEGAKRILINAAKLKKKEKLLLICHQRLMPIAEAILRAIQSLGYRNVLFVVVPSALRPVTKITEMLKDAVVQADVCIYLVDRMPEETHVEWGSLRQAVLSHGGRYLTMHDPKISYLDEGGVFADYRVVREKTERIKEVLRDSEEVHITSTLGTNLTFRLNHEAGVQMRCPGASDFQQVPEGEVSCQPVQESVSGTLFVDSVVTGLGVPEFPIIYKDFVDGVCGSIKGNTKTLNALLSYVERLGGGSTLNLLDTIEEFSLGTNDWAKLDDNISNCEKVSGTIHFGIGHQKKWSHIDHIVTRTTVTSTNSKGKKTCLIRNGRLRI